VPIVMLAQDVETARVVGESIGKAGGNLVVIASSDLTHYEPHSVAMEKDSSIIEAIVALDEEELYERCERLRCTMCGYGPVAAAMVASKQMNGNKASLLKYATSGDTSGDFSRVVGYGSIVIRR
jgi:AmmeMemoRadiSam system protein B